MDDATRRRIEALFHLAVDLRETERAEVLARECGDDAALRIEVEDLIARSQAGARFLERPAVLVELEPVPERIGPFKILRKLAEGGMGCVYEAEQESPRRTIALKVLRGGALSEASLKRFQREAQLLARLQHPGIAQVHQAGTFRTNEGGLLRPYFAMELIRGLPIDQYAREHGLRTRERLELVARLCDAVEHAHAHGVIHRDLKPANILVGADGQPKILDFGIAHSVERGSTLQTAPGELLGTLAYMSPEQAAGRSEDLDARSDVYSLGVLLYQLLAGHLPYELQGKPLLEAGRTIQEEEPTRLGSLRPELRGDIETIAAKALAKEVERRYASAAALAADLRRQLGHQPIVARPTGTFYRLGKFARRNRGLVGGVAAALLVLLVSLVVVSMQVLRLDRSLSRQDEVNRFLRSLLEGANPYPTASNDVFTSFGVRASLFDVFDETVARLERTPKPLSHVHDEASFLQAMGMNYFGAGRYEDGAKCARRALELLDGRGRAEEQIRARCKVALAYNLTYLLDSFEAERLAREAVEDVERLYGERHEEMLAALNCHWVSCLYLGYVDDCLKISQRMSRILDSDGAPLDYTDWLVDAMHARMLHRCLRRTDEALELVKNALQRGQASRNNRSIGVAFGHLVHAEILNARGSLGDAVRECSQAVALWESSAGPTAVVEHRLVLCMLEYAHARGKGGTAPLLATLGDARNRLGASAPLLSRMIADTASFLAWWNQEDAARELYSEFVAMLERGQQLLPNHAQVAHQYGRFLLRRGELCEAEEAYRLGLDIASCFSREQWQRHHWDDRLLLSDLALLLYEQGRAAEAEPLLDRLAERADEHGSPLQANSVAWSLYLCARFEDSESIARRAVQGLRATPASRRQLVDALDTWAASLEALERMEEAEDAWREADALWEASPYPGYESIALRFGRCLSRMGKLDEADVVLLRTQQALETASTPATDLLQDVYAARASLYAGWDLPAYADDAGANGVAEPVSQASDA